MVHANMHSSVGWLKNGDGTLQITGHATSRQKDVCANRFMFVQLGWKDDFTSGVKRQPVK